MGQDRNFCVTWLHDQDEFKKNLFLTTCTVHILIVLIARILLLYKILNFKKVSKVVNTSKANKFKKGAT